MKYTLFSLTLITLFASGCGTNPPNPETPIQNTETTSTPVSVTTPDTQIPEPIPAPTPSSTPQSYNTYTNDELGISFQYQAGIGEPQENRYKEQELLWVSFINKSDTSVRFSLSPSEYPSLRTCTDYLTNGLVDGDMRPQNCSPLRVDNRDMVILTFTQGRSNGPSKQIHLQTKQGVWNLSTADTVLYTEIEKIARTIQFTE